MTERPHEPIPMPVRCARCGVEFGCGARMASCWCQQLPPLDPTRIDTGAGCYCPACLAALVAAEGASD